MPILIKDFQWSETEKLVYINVPLKGVKGSKADIFCSREFLKVSYPPFLFEILLFQPIDDVKSSAKIKDGCIIFTLLKEQERWWSQLSSPRSGDKSYVLKKKTEAIEYVQKKTEELQKEKSEIKEKTKKYSLKEMMKLEEHDRSRIEGVKESERIRTMKELEQWKEQKRQEAEREKLKILETYKSQKTKGNQLEKTEHQNQIIFEDFVEEIDSCKIVELDDIESSNDHEDENRPKSVEQPDTMASKSKKHNLKSKSAGPRQSGKIDVNFTPRVFPTPQRESKAAEENEWLQKQANARKQFEIDEPDLAEHEKDPIWLKDKGGQLYSSGNFLGAVNAYNLAIKIQPGMPILYINRAACHLKLRNLYKCAEDCSTALEIMMPAVEANAKGRLKAHLRRAAAFCELELYVEALQDYEAAIKIDPKNEKLVEDASKLRTIIQSGDN